MTRIALAVDSRAVAEGLFGGDDLEQFLTVWREVEARLQERVLSPGMVLPVTLENGRLDFTVLSPLEPVTVGPDTEFGVVSVLEPRKVLQSYRCSTCSRSDRNTYGPFICARCPKGSNRVCDEHAGVLPGSLEATCPAHVPRCAACAVPAVARCTGPRCRAATAWCATHLEPHPSDPATGYCHPCSEDLFPACGYAPGCSAIGSVPCEHLDTRGRQCGARRCPRHAWRWQVFGPQSVGLGRCDAHAATRAADPADVLYQVLGACALKGMSAPTIPSLRHAVVKATGQQPGLREVSDLAVRQPDSAPALRRQLADLVARHRSRWEKQVIDGETGERQAADSLVGWLRRTGRDQVVQALSVRNWVRPRDGRNGELWVFCDPQVLPRWVRDEAAAALGFDIRVVR